MTRSNRHHSRGVTLVELMLAVAVSGVALAATAPVLVGANESYLLAAQARRISDDLAHSMEMTMRIMREAPVDLDGASVAIQVAEPGRALFADGSGLSFDGDDLWIITPDGDTAMLCRDLGEFSIAYLGADGVTDVSQTPELTRRIAVRMGKEGFTLVGVAMPRSLMGAGS